MAEVALLLGVGGAWACFLGLVHWVAKIERKVDALTPLQAQVYTGKDGQPTYVVVNPPITQEKIESLRVLWEKAWAAKPPTQGIGQKAQGSRLWVDHG